MRKKILATMFFVVLGLLMVSSGAYAYPPIGATVEFNNSYGTLGGEYEMWEGNIQYPNTFCVEQSEYLNFNDQFMVAGYEAPAPETALLYYHFITGQLFWYDYDNVGVGRQTSADKLQEAIWYYQGQVGGGTNSYTIYADVWLDNHPGDAALALSQVRILDLYYADGRGAQDVLAYFVPEPMTLLLLGLGLVGLAVLRRIA